MLREFSQASYEIKHFSGFLDGLFPGPWKQCVTALTHISSGQQPHPHHAPLLLPLPLTQYSKENPPLKNKLCGKPTTLSPFLGGTYKSLERAVKRQKHSPGLPWSINAQSMSSFLCLTFSFSLLHEKTSRDRKFFFMLQRGFWGSWLVWGSTEVKHKHVSPENLPCSIHPKQKEFYLWIPFLNQLRVMLAHGSLHGTCLSLAACLCLHITLQSCWWQRCPMYPSTVLCKHLLTFCPETFRTRSPYHDPPFPEHLKGRSALDFTQLYELWPALFVWLFCAVAANSWTPALWYIHSVLWYIHSVLQTHLTSMSNVTKSSLQLNIFLTTC